ncbi:MAG: hypothetical protein OEW91_10690 [Acidimicrobiia bacterium]|nr:hypothetical protein [Acidimicrobiia bacterium]
MSVQIPQNGGPTVLFDDFISNDAVTDNAIGQLGWQFTTIGNAATLAYQTATKNGVLRITTAATADGDGTALHLFPDGLVLKAGVEFGARVRHPVELASLNFRFGMDDSVTATAPGTGVWFGSDAGVLTGQAFSNDHGDSTAVTVAGHPDLTSGTTLVVGEWVDLQCVLSGENAQGGPGRATFYINGVNVGSTDVNIDDDEEVEPKLAVWQDSGGADAVAFEVDYAYFVIPRGARA